MYRDPGPQVRTDDQVQGFKLNAEGHGDGLGIHNLQHLLEIYADDMTIFMEPSEENLRNVINILNNFFKLSGLKISASKTKAVWFGSKSNSEQRLCQDLGLKWVNKFTLLGIEFDSSLSEMSNNFIEKIKKMEKMLSNWSYRYLTPFGKITVIKSLGLSKLSHIALVLPNPTKEMIKRVESAFYTFLWGKGKSEKVRREDTKLPVTYGGLAMPDINIFWTAFKFSWLRRLLTTNSFWPKILLKSVSEILNYEVSACELLQLGASKLVEISKRIKNPFWKQVLFSTLPLTENAIFYYPEKILNTPFFFNPLVVRNRVIKPTDFPELVIPALLLAHFYYPGTNTLMNWNDFQTRYGIVISHDKFIDIRYTINTAISKLNVNQSKLNCANFPLKPILIDIALSIEKGCSRYYKILTKKQNLTNKIHLRETKWHLELNLLFSTNFWDKSRRFYASINFDNNLKWLQFQIVRNSLQTNYIVSHFIPNVSATCSYCENRNSFEKISHLFWTCSKVSEFLEEVFTFISTTGIVFAPTKSQFLFGFHDENFFSPKNFISMISKKYIWLTKFKTANLSLVGFKGLLKSYVTDLKNVFELKSKPELFVEWNTVLNSL